MNSLEDLRNFNVRKLAVLFAKSDEEVVEFFQSIPGNYRHSWVNHTTNFVNPEDSACTNGVEGLWSQAKRRHKRQNGTSRGFIDSYLDEFMWFREFGGKDSMYNIWSQIHEYYKL
ncbi:ISXO2-like transposase domain-containing protein [Ditylenchus destructor]|uniref:ISXO2-like transposase domain-containing protein n=1 Tax=Ditylenchus destructor TaxID=166010 RepID=A0AAD4N6E7_9BILA|nr:ISXO2-like transposase domain-containing protein [Ditylenchus destructor]